MQYIQTLAKVIGEDAISATTDVARCNLYKQILHIQVLEMLWFTFVV